MQKYSLEIDGDTIDDIDKIFSNLKNDDKKEKEYINSYTKPNEDFNSQKQIICKQNNHTIEILEKALLHVRTYDSKETAKKLLSRAYHVCPSFYTKRFISDASKSLNAAIKAEKWKASKRKHKHVREDTIQNNLNSFYEKLATAVEQIQIELKKQSNSYFNSIKKEYHSDLPLKIAPTKESILKKSAVVVMIIGEINNNFDYQKLESRLYLIKNAHVVGINNHKVKNIPSKLKQLERKLGATIYPAVISRPSENINWYLVLNFGCKVTYASFTENLSLPSFESNGEENKNYSDFIRLQDETIRNEMRVRTNNLKDLREEFQTENNVIYKEINVLKEYIEAYKIEKESINEEYKKVTSFDDQYLDIKFHNTKLYKYSIMYRDVLISEDVNYREAAVAAVKYRVKAGSLYYEFIEVKRTINKFGKRIKFLEELIQSKKDEFSRKLGLISIKKHVEL